MPDIYTHTSRCLLYTSLRTDVCMVMPVKVTPKSDVGFKVIPAGRYAIFLYKGPYDNLQAVYLSLIHILYKRKNKGRFLCESDCKDKNFIYYNPNFFGSFLFFSLSGIPLFTKSICQGFLLLESGCKSTPFSYTLQIYQTIFSNYF